MSRRLNLYGFSLAQMRRLFGSRDEVALGRILEGLTQDSNHWPSDQLVEVGEIVRQAVLRGIPFPGLQEESHLHAVAAGAMAAYEQDWLITDASAYHDSALEQGLWGQFGKYARPEIKAFLRGLVEGVPLFGQQPPSDGSAYAAVSLEKLRFFQKGLGDLLVQVEYRVGQRKSPTDEDRAAIEFATEFCGWIDQVIEAERDLWFTFG